MSLSIEDSVATKSLRAMLSLKVSSYLADGVLPHPQLATVIPLAIDIGEKDRSALGAYCDA